MEFVHTPLNDPAKEIRIATIYPSASIDSPVRCGLSTFTLSTAPNYEALSYCWGDENDTRPIFLEERPYRITTNLFSALRQLRLAETERRVWVDSMCINQSSHYEKNHQIPLMGDIYKRARQVVAWLGDSDEETRIALHLIADWAVTTKRLSDSRPPVEEVRGKLDHLVDPKSWDALCNLLERPYWTRLWALQECVLATKLVFQCGKVLIEHSLLVDFLRAEDRVKRPWFWKYFTANQMAMKRNLRPMAIDTFVILPHLTNNPETFRYPSILQYTARLNCRDPRDKLYAILGLAALDPFSKQVPLEPDYSKNVATIFSDFASAFMLTTKTLDLLQLAGVNNHGLELKGELPSWAPDLTDLPYGGPVDFESFDPTGFPKVQDICFNKRGELRTSGVICDIVINAKEVPYLGDRACLLRTYETFAPAGRHPTGLPWRQVLFRTLFMVGTSASSQPSFKLISTEENIALEAIGFIVWMGKAFVKRNTSNVSVSQYGKNTYVDWFYLWTHGLEAFATATEQQKMDAFLHEFCGSRDAVLEISNAYTASSHSLDELESAFFHNSRIEDLPGIFMTEKGYYGICTRKVLPGDRICVLPGCRTPLIVRRREPLHYYLLVDSAYIYGMMHGEIMKNVQDGAAGFEQMVFM